jgi:hypothetical protein
MPGESKQLGETSVGDQKAPPFSRPLSYLRLVRAIPLRASLIILAQVLVSAGFILPVSILRVALSNESWRAVKPSYAADSQQKILTLPLATPTHTSSGKSIGAFCCTKSLPIPWSLMELRFGANVSYRG